MQARAADLHAAHAHVKHQQAMLRFQAQQHAIAARVDEAMEVAAAVRSAARSAPAAVLAAMRWPVRALAVWLGDIVDLPVYLVRRIRGLPTTAHWSGALSAGPDRSVRARTWITLAVAGVTATHAGCQAPPPTCIGLVDLSGSMSGATDAPSDDLAVVALRICAAVTRLVPGAHIEIRSMGKALAAPPLWAESIPATWPQGNIARHKQDWVEAHVATLRKSPRATVPYSDIVRAITLAGTRLQANPPGNQYLVILSDGRDERAQADPSAYAWHLGRTVPAPDAFVEWLQAEGELPALHGVHVAFGGVYPAKQPGLSGSWTLADWQALIGLWQHVLTTGGAASVVIRQDVSVDGLTHDLIHSPGWR